MFHEHTFCKPNLTPLQRTWHLPSYLLISFYSCSDCKPLWAFEEITPRSYKIKSAEQLELFVASVVQIFQASDSGSKVQEAMAKVALQWATSCSSRHYAGRSFQVFRALKVPLSWSMLSDVLSRLVESVGDSSEDVQVSGFDCLGWVVSYEYSRSPLLLKLIPVVIAFRTVLRYRFHFPGWKMGL